MAFTAPKLSTLANTRRHRWPHFQFLRLMKWNLLLFLGLLNTALFAQQITISGSVSDVDTEEPQPFCNVYVPGSTLGVTTDIDGHYEIVLDAAVADSLAASALGYDEQIHPIGDSSHQVINFYLRSSDLALAEVEVFAGENPANAILRKIVRNKRRNDRFALPAYEADIYTKMELDLDNIQPEMRDRKMFRKFQFVFDNIDSVSDVKPFLPAYVSETFADLYYFKPAGEEKIVPRARKVSGINNESVIGFIGSMHEQYNIYDNLIELLGKKFISPFANAALGTYEYYIMDSTMIKGHWSYKLKFKPKRKQENTFYGDFWVSMEDYSIEILNMRMSSDVNINLVERILIYQEFEPQNDSVWLPNKEKTIIDFAATENAPGIIGRKIRIYERFHLQPDNGAERYRKADPEGYDPDALNRPDSFWMQRRPEKLSANEAKTYAMVDSIQEVPVFKTYVDVIQTAVSGYKTIGKFRVGPYFQLYGYNAVEGHRFQLGGGTSHKFSKKVFLEGYAAYGLNDRRWKYGWEAEYVFDKRFRTEAGLSYRKDIDQRNENSEDFRPTGLLEGIYRRPIAQKLLEVEEYKAYYQKTWKKGWSLRSSLIHRSLRPIPGEEAMDMGFNFQYLNNFYADAPGDMDTLRSLRASEAHFRLRYAYKERLLKDAFGQTSLGSDYPIVSLRYTLGLKGIFGSDFEYHRLVLNIDHFFYVGALGWLSYEVQLGKVFGTLPYLLLETHPGNETYFYNANSFNLMNRYEFVSDAYATLMTEYHLDGFLLNRIPLMRKLKWRTVLGWRAAWGSLSKRNREPNRLNEYQLVENTPYYGAFDRGPYMEGSVGLENIFKIIRVDAIWRLSYLDNVDVAPFSIRATLAFNF